MEEIANPSEEADQSSTVFLDAENLKRMEELAGDSDTSIMDIDDGTPVFMLFESNISELTAVRGLRVIGQLVDVGMLHIPREILWRTGPLGAAEFELVRPHVERGYETLRRIDFPWPVAEAVRQHHERLDGSGYPRALKGDEILLEARIVAVADAVEAMLSQRPQRQALSLTACIDELQTQAGRRYDAAAVRACLKLLRERHAQPEPEARAGQRIA